MSIAFFFLYWAINLETKILVSRRKYDVLNDEIELKLACLFFFRGLSYVIFSGGHASLELAGLRPSLDLSIRWSVGRSVGNQNKMRVYLLFISYMVF